MTALAAAKLVNIKTSADYFHRLPLFITKAAYIWKCLKVKFKRMKAIFGALKGKLGQEKLEKLRNLFFETKWQSIHRRCYEYAISNTSYDYSREVNKVVLFI